MNTKLIGSAIIALLLGACQKEQEEREPFGDAFNNEVTATSAEFYASDVESVIDQLVSSYEGQLKDGFEPCATVVLDTTGSLHAEVHVDFGDENCLCADGKLRRGELHVTFTGPYAEPGTVITTMPMGYYVNNHLIEGERIVTNTGYNDNNQLVFTVQLDEGQVTSPNGEYPTQITSSRVRTWIAGADTWAWADDEYTVAFETTLIGPWQGVHTRTTVQPLQIHLDCAHPLSGIVQTNPAVGQMRMLDYGSGQCDDIATLTVGDQSYTINLP